MARTMKLTSPYMRGDDVRKLQQELKKDKYLQGTPDGVFGPDTSRAVYRAKHWLGYRVPDHTAAQMLVDYLTGKRKLTDAMVSRRKARQKALAARPVRQKMLDEAKKWEGTKESPPGSNRVKFSAWYGLVGPWCAMFTSYCGVTVNARGFARGKRWAYVPYVVADAKHGRNNLAITYSPQEGDLVTFDWDNDGVADHIGFFVHWNGGGKTKFRSLEGNTGVGNDSNGGEVMWRDRNKSDVIAFVHVGN